jgi:membrane-bound acyltransferase YfiQ involved in biofilm formation
LLVRLGFAALGLGVLAAIPDWTIYVHECFFGVNRFAIPAYTRPSLIFLAIAVVIFAIRWQPRSYAVVRFMSKYSLGVYCVHPFLVPIGYRILEKEPFTGPADILLPLVAVVGLSYIGAYLMTWFVRDELIR